ncbi:MAG: multifunctional CCA addition/repair protein [Pseudomonadales bacterium]|nr:multifunctional CCA addition/repair protein [Pseudomonadales bacterium]
MQVYLVGGAVRDRLLGLDVRERDWVVVGATAKQLLDQGYQQVGKGFPVFLHPNTKEEYALARSERKVGKGYLGFETIFDSSITLEQDLLRRDLTINAIAESPDGSLIDPYGGQQDLDNRVLKHVSDAFVEDPLRVLRVARFAARFAPLGFRVADSTMELMKEISASGELKELTAERIWKEMDRALAEAGAVVFFEVLRECGALMEILPELDALFGVQQSQQVYSQTDVGIHSLNVLGQAVELTNDSAARFAALTQHLGKAMTEPGLWPEHAGHSQNGKLIVDELCERLTAPKHYRQLAALVAQTSVQCHQADQMNALELLQLLETLDLFRRPDRLELFLAACTADLQASTEAVSKDYPQASVVRRALGAAMLPNAKELVASGCKGPQVGIELKIKRIEAIVLELGREVSSVKN